MHRDYHKVAVDFCNNEEIILTGTDESCGVDVSAEEGAHLTPFAVLNKKDPIVLKVPELK